MKNKAASLLQRQAPFWLVCLVVGVVFGGIVYAMLFLPNPLLR